MSGGQVRLSRLMFRSLGRRLPNIQGEITAADLTSSVTIRRDEFGVPHINAGNDRDAWFALGFCQGQDRAFQLEMILRSVRGTLSEATGKQGLPVDRLSRRAGIKRISETQLKRMDGDIRDALAAFAAGVNAGRDQGLSRQSHEFSLLRIEPTQWEGSDALGYLKMMSLLVSTNWAEEVARYQILLRDGIDALEAIEPVSDPRLPVTNPPGVEAGESASRLIEDARRVAEELGLESGGSNNWVVSGSRTKSGNPILANDTHLSPVLPTHFYLAHITTPDWGLAGGVFAGCPGFFLGHNGHAAWGVTIGYIDNTDLFIEEIGPDSVSVREGDQFVPCAVRDEHITVKGSGDVVERVLETGRGPIIGPALEGNPGALSVSAVWLQDVPFRSFFGAHRWRSFDECCRDLNQHPNLSLNVAYADCSGDIGWKLAGSVPQRSGSGAIPLLAANTANHWQGAPESGDDRLAALNPECGYIATANNRPVPNAEDAGLGVDWMEGYRISRIQELLAGRDDWEPGAMWLMQLDTVSLPWKELKPLIEGVRPVDEDSRIAKMMLERWDGNVSAVSTGAAFYEVFISMLLRKIVERAAPLSYGSTTRNAGRPDPTYRYFGSMRMGQLISLVRERPAGWFADGWNAVLAHSLGDALRTLRFRCGNHERHWYWGSVRQLELTHHAGRGPLASVFNRGPYSVGGDNNTIHAAGVATLDPIGGGVRTIATARTVIEVGDWDNARFVLLGGQSGNPMSPHYDDQIPVWLQGRGIPVPWSQEAIENITQTTLTLMPEHD